LVFFSLIFFVSGECFEGDTKECGYSNVGECSYGYQVCTDGKWSICFGAKGPNEEVCDDGKDNDCDGEVDEGCECSSGESKSCNPGDYLEKGICKFGKEYCTSEGEWSGECVDFIGPDVTELCGAGGEGNGLDDDCDGEVDEDCKIVVVEDVPPVYCYNRVKDSEEEGIDCGGVCEECNDCSDGVKEKDEEKVSVDLGLGNISDCGGLNCPPCPTCFDKILNQGEEDIDCGGPCVKSCVDEDESDDDNDGLVKKVELKAGTDPKNPDSDYDGILDGQDIMPLCPNGFCDEFYGETGESCPEDCGSERKGVIFVVLFILIVLVAGVVLFFYFQFRSSLKKVDVKKPVKKVSFSAYKRVSSGRKRKKVRETKAEKKLRESIDRFGKIRKK